MSEEKVVTKAVAESAERVQKKIDDGDAPKAEKTVAMSSGVVFKIKEVPQFAYVDLRNSLPEPMPPVIYNPSLDREEPNTEDPRYKAQYSNWTTAISSGITDINIIFGTAISEIPEDVAQPDSEEFMDKLRVMLSRFGWSRQEIREVGKTTRYLYWVKYEAAKSGFDEDGDLSKLLTAVNRVSGVPEEDVTEEMEKFRD